MQIPTWSVHYLFIGACDRCGRHITVEKQWQGKPQSALNAASIWGGVSKFRNLGIKEVESGKRRHRRRVAAGKKENDLDN